MQKDMHYYGTFAMAKAAGIPHEDAAVIAYASQFTDDSTYYNSVWHDDGGQLFAITTAHHPAQTLTRTAQDHLEGLKEQRKIWVPFHFFPGGAGATFHEKLICQKNGPIVKEMVDNHLEMALKKAYCLELLGICAHVYADTFSHYGFSGMSHEYNSVKQSSIDFVRQPSEATEKYIERKRQSFFHKFIGIGSELISRGLGHSGAATLPDLPYLHWEFEFKYNRSGNGRTSTRNNTATFLEACESLHSLFVRFAKMRYADSRHIPFSDLKEKIRAVLLFEDGENERCQKWIDSGLAKGAPKYDPSIWENEKVSAFVRAAKSQDTITCNIYRFHQAAAYHRYYVLKDLLPSHGIAVY